MHFAAQASSFCAYIAMQSQFSLSYSPPHLHFLFLSPQALHGVGAAGQPSCSPPAPWSHSAPSSK